MTTVKALSPWAKTTLEKTRALNPRLETLDGFTIGLYEQFKWSAPLFCQELKRQILEKYPNASFSEFQYKKDKREICKDADIASEFRSWANGVDAVVAAYADAGSCALFMGYNAAYMEEIGKPTVLICRNNMYASAKRGLSARGVPNLRTVLCGMTDITVLPVDEIPEKEEDIVKKFMRSEISIIVDDVVAALTWPLTEAEQTVRDVNSPYDKMVFEGTAEEIEKTFYHYGWTTGAPIVAPTRELVDKMIAASGYPGDYVVAEMPPMMGKATVEKIAINAVMAGCQPVHMPVVIAAIRAIRSSNVCVEGWMCSVIGWGLCVVVHGPICKDLGISTGASYLTSYNKSSTVITRALNYVLLNIAGIRPGTEDMSMAGHVNRFGVLFGENEDLSPWPGGQTDLGLPPSESSVTVFWYRQQYLSISTTAEQTLKSLCVTANMPEGGVFGVGYGYACILSPLQAQNLAAKGYTKDKIRKYICEYVRQPADTLNYGILVGNNHLPEHIIIPETPGATIRRYFTEEEIFVAVAGPEASPHTISFDAISGHGGPGTSKVELPSNWDELCAENSDCLPQYITY